MENSGVTSDIARGGKREDAGRPKGTKTGRNAVYKTISISALPEEVGTIKAKAAKSGKTVSHYPVNLRLKRTDFKRGKIARLVIVKWR